MNLRLKERVTQQLIPSALVMSLQVFLPLLLLITPSIIPQVDSLGLF